MLVYFEVVGDEALVPVAEGAVAVRVEGLAAIEGDCVV